MDIMVNKNADKLPVIYSSEIEYYAKQLDALLKAYRKHIAVNDDKQEAALRELEYYAAQLTSGNYDMVIMNSKEIIHYENPLPCEVPF